MTEQNTKNIKVTTNNGLGDCSIELVHAIEKDIDVVMARYGFTRTISGKGGDFLEFNYRQFGKAL
jgi:hypothetical protein